MCTELRNWLGNGDQRAWPRRDKEDGVQRPPSQAGQHLYMSL